MKGDFFCSLFLMATFKIHFLSSYAVLATAILHIPVVERTSSVLHHLLMWHAPNACWCKNNSFLLPIEHRSCRVARSVFSVLHFWAFSFLSPLKSTFRYAFHFPYRKRVFCESPFFPKWPGSYFQKPSRVPFPEDYIKTWVILLFLSALPHPAAHTEYPFCISSSRQLSV